MCRTVDRVMWFVIGAAIGAGIALLYAPKTGKDTRRLIRRKAEDAKDAVVETGEDILDKGREVYKKGTGAVTDAYKKGAQVATEAAGLFERGRKAAGL